MIQSQVERQQELEIVHHHRSRDERSVEEQPLDVLSQEIGGTDAKWREALSRLPGVCLVLALAEEVQERRGFYVHHRVRIDLVRYLVVSVKEERL